MIKTQNLTPEIYYNRSRDFQLLGRIYDIIFNYMKNNADLLNNAPLSDDFDTSMLDLVATTLGFKETHSYNVNELKALCSIFSVALKNKGNIQSINLVLDMLANVYNSNSRCYAELDTDDVYVLNVFIPENITNITIFKDVLNYILPAGIVCNVINQEAIKETIETVVPMNSDSDEQKNRQDLQVTTSTVFAPIKESDGLSKYFGKLSNTTVLRVNKDSSTESDELAKLRDIKNNEYEKWNKGSGE